MDKKKNVFKIIVTVVGYIVIFMMIVALVLILRGNIRGEVTFIGGQAIMWVKTPSMEPKIPERSYIVIEKTTPADVRVNNIIVFRSDDPMLDGAYNTHRVVEVIGDHEEFVTKGDNNAVADKYTAKAENIVGKYKRNLPMLSVFGRLLQTPTGVIISVTLMFGIILLLYVPDMVKATKERTELIEKKRREQIDELVKQEVEKLRAADEKKAKKSSEASDVSDAEADKKTAGDADDDGSAQSLTEQ